MPEIDAFVDAVEGAGRSEGPDAARQYAGAAPAHRPAAVPFRRAGDPRAKNNRPMVETLLEFGANINARSHWWAGSFGVLDGTDPEQAAWLIERGAIVDIHAAAGLGRFDTVKAWLATDPALVHAPGGDGQRPLHFASTTRSSTCCSTMAPTSTPATSTTRRRRLSTGSATPELCRHLIARGAAVDIFMAAALGDRRWWSGC